MGDLLQVEGINSKGYGIVPKLAMQDKRLTATAKAIYAYFCSYAGAGRTAFPSVGKITGDLDLSRNSYYKHFSLLKQCGYVKAEQDIGGGGKFTRNIYTLLDEVPCTKICDTVSPCTKSWDTKKWDTKICATNNNSIENQQVLKSISQSGRADDSVLSMDELTRTIQANIYYSDFERCYTADLELVDEIVSIIVDALASSGPTVRMDGEIKPRELVQRQLMKVGHEHVRHVIEQFQGHIGRIQRKRQYLLTMLYNSTLELDAHMTNWVATDMANGWTIDKAAASANDTDNGPAQDTSKGNPATQADCTMLDGSVQDESEV